MHFKCGIYLLLLSTTEHNVQRYELCTNEIFKCGKAALKSVTPPQQTEVPVWTIWTLKEMSKCQHLESIDTMAQCPLTLDMKVKQECHGSN